MGSGPGDGRRTRPIRGMLIAVLVGVGVHLLLVLLERGVAAIPEHHLSPFLRSLPALLTGFLYSRSFRGSPQASLVRGAVAGGLSGLLGSSAAAGLGVPGLADVALVVSVTGTSVLLGALAAAVTAVLRGPRGDSGPPT